MGFETKNKIDPTFNMSSMTDMIFLLLIFFLLTSNFVTPSGLEIDTPSSKGGKKVLPEINVGITKNGDYFINEVKTDISLLEDYLTDILRDRSEENRVVAIAADKDVEYKHVATVLGIVMSLKARPILSVKPE